jgi:hypothetical protein
MLEKEKGKSHTQKNRSIHLVSSSIGERKEEVSWRKKRSGVTLWVCVGGGKQAGGRTPA